MNNLDGFFYHQHHIK